MFAFLSSFKYMYSTANKNIYLKKCLTSTKRLTAKSVSVPHTLCTGGNGRVTQLATAGHTQRFPRQRVNR